MACLKPRRAFDELPFEVVEAVTAFLDLRDIRNLRLVSQTIAAKSGRGTFKKYFANKTINWKSTAELRSFVQMTKPQRMGCFLKSLAIRGRATTASRTFSKELALLTEALENLRRNSVYGGLETVILTVHGQSVFDINMTMPEKFQNWRSVWQVAFQTFHIATQTLADSSISVQKWIYSEVSIVAALHVTKIAPVLERVDLSKTLVNLKSLSLSLSHHLEENLNNETSEFSLAAGQGHVDDIKRLLALCPNLGSLELHWYNLHSYEISGAQTEEQGFFSKIAQLDNHFSKLRHCRLDGIDTIGTALPAFFKQTTQLTRLTMDHVYLRVRLSNKPPAPLDLPTLGKSS